MAGLERKRVLGNFTSLYCERQLRCCTPHTIFFAFSLTLPFNTFPHFFFEKKALSHFFRACRRFSQFTMVIYIHAEEVESKGAVGGHNTRFVVHRFLFCEIEWNFTGLLWEDVTHSRASKALKKALNDDKWASWPLQIDLSPHELPAN
jgi:hypothetical protein